MNLNNQELLIFVFLVSILTFSIFKLIDYIQILFINTKLIEGLDPDEDPTKTDYTKLIKSVHKMGFSDKGSWESLNGNVKAMKNLVEGVISDQTKLVKGGGSIGIKLLSDTGFTCNDPEGNEQQLYTYLDNSGDPNIGLAMEVGHAVEKYGESLKDFSSGLQGSIDTTCEEVELEIITNSGKKKKEKAHLQRTEIDKIDKNNIVSIKTYSENTEEESFNNMNEKINKLLINDKIFYKDNGIFLYFLLLSSLFLYFILILIINSS